MASPHKITVEIYRADRQRIAEIEAEMTVEWAASGGAKKKPTPADAIHRALGAVAGLEIEIEAMRLHAIDLIDSPKGEMCEAECYTSFDEIPAEWKEKYRAKARGAPRER